MKNNFKCCYQNEKDTKEFLAFGEGKVESCEKQCPLNSKEICYR